MSQPSSNFGYSAEVDLRLEISGREISLHAVSPDQITLREPIAAPPGDAVLIVSIDGRQRRTPIVLPDGLQTDSKVARIIAKSPSRSDAPLAASQSA